MTTDEEILREYDMKLKRSSYDNELMFCDEALHTAEPIHCFRGSYPEHIKCGCCGISVASLLEKAYAKGKEDKESEVGQRLTSIATELATVANDNNHLREELQISISELKNAQNIAENYKQAWNESEREVARLQQKKAPPIPPAPKGTGILGGS